MIAELERQVYGNSRGDYTVPTVAEVVEKMDRLGASLLNDVAEARLAGIDGLVAVIVLGIGNPPMNIASEELTALAQKI